MYIYTYIAGERYNKGSSIQYRVLEQIKSKLNSVLAK